MNELNPSAQIAGQNALPEPSSTEVRTTGSSGSSGSGKSGTVQNMSQLKEQEPELYHEMMLAMAQQICDQSRKHDEELRRIIHEGQQQ